MDQVKIINYNDDKKIKSWTSLTNSITTKVKYKKDKKICLIWIKNQINVKNAIKIKNCKKWIKLTSIETWRINQSKNYWNYVA